MIAPNQLAMRIIENQPGYNVVYSAATAPDGKIYLGLSGEFDMPGCYAKLIAYDPGKDEFEELVDFSKVISHPQNNPRHPHSKIHTAICVGNDGKVFCATHMTAPPYDEDFYHYWHVYNDSMRNFEGSRLIIYDPKTQSAKDFGVIAPGGSCRWLSYNPVREELYLTSFLTSHFFVVKLKTGEVRDLGRIGQYDFMGPAYSADGNVYTTDSRGFIIRYTPDSEKLETLPLQIPKAAWDTDDGNGLFHFVPGPDKLKLYGCSFTSQRVFEFDPSVGKFGKIRDYGMLNGEDEMNIYPAESPMARTMTVGNDGYIYVGSKNYISGKRGSCIYTINIESGEKQNHGKMELDGLFPMNTPVASTVGLDSNVYFAGEKPYENSPLAIMIFNRNGIDLKTPQKYYEQYPVASPIIIGDAKYDYHLHTREDNAIFVSKGNIIAQELGYRGRIPLIPRNESAITALASGNHGLIYGATSGEKSHFFVFMPLSKKLMPIMEISKDKLQISAMDSDAEGFIYLAGDDGKIRRYDAPQAEIEFLRRDVCDRGEFRTYKQMPSKDMFALHDFNTPIPDEKIKCFTVDKKGNMIYGLSASSGKFFICDLSTAKSKTVDIFSEYIMNLKNISSSIICASNGLVYFSGHHGRIIIYDPDNDTFRDSAMKIPVGAGREYLNSAVGMHETCEGIIYGGTSSDGFLFCFDIQNEKLRNLGKASSENSIRDLSIGKDGTVWILSGRDDELTHLAKYNPDDSTMEDCGIMRSKMPFSWIVHHANVLLTGLDGELYIGESDAISHLMIYYPPIKEKANALDEV